MEFLKELNNKFLITPKLLLLVVNMQFYTLHLLRGIYMSDVFEIKITSYGPLMGFILAFSFFGTVFIAGINDKLNRPKLFILGCLILSCVFFQILNIPFMKSLPFMAIMLVFFFFTLFSSAVQPFLDKVVIDIISSIPGVGTETYGRQRLWGTLGYVITNYLVEAIVVTEGVGKEGKKKKEYHWDRLRWYQLLATIVASVTGFIFIKEVDQNRQRRSRQTVFSGWVALLTNVPYMFFILIVFMNGITRASMTLFLTIYLDKVLKLKELKGVEGGIWPFSQIINFFMGYPIATTTVFGVASEIAVFYFSKPIISTFGLFWPLLIAQVAQVVRFVGYYVLPMEFEYLFLCVCGLELMKGFNFGFTQMSGVQIANMYCPVEYKSTGQMIYSGTFVGLATAVSGLLSRFIFGSIDLKDEKVSSTVVYLAFRPFFLINLGITLITIMLFFMKYGFIDKILFSRLSGDNVGSKKREINMDESSADKIPIKNR